MPNAQPQLQSGQGLSHGRPPSQKRPTCSTAMRGSPSALVVRPASLVSAEEINLMVYAYLLESSHPLTASQFLTESTLLTSPSHPFPTYFPPPPSSAALSTNRDGHLSAHPHLSLPISSTANPPPGILPPSLGILPGFAGSGSGIASLQNSRPGTSSGPSPANGNGNGSFAGMLANGLLGASNANVNGNAEAGPSGSGGGSGSRTPRGGANKDGGLTPTALQLSRAASGGLMTLSSRGRDKGKGRAATEEQEEKEEGGEAEEGEKKEVDEKKDADGDVDMDAGGGEEVKVDVDAAKESPESKDKDKPEEPAATTTGATTSDQPPNTTSDPLPLSNGKATSPAPPTSTETNGHSTGKGSGATEVESAGKETEAEKEKEKEAPAVPVLGTGVFGSTIPEGELVRVLQQGLMWREAKMHVRSSREGLVCTTPLKLLGSHKCTFTLASLPPQHPVAALSAFQDDLVAPPRPVSKSSSTSRPTGPARTSSSKSALAAGGASASGSTPKSKDKERGRVGGKESDLNGSGSGKARKEGVRVTVAAPEEEGEMDVDEDGEEVEPEEEKRPSKASTKDKGKGREVIELPSSKKPVSSSSADKDKDKSRKPSSSTATGSRKVKKTSASAAAESSKTGSGVPSRMEKERNDREGSAGTSGTGKSGGSGGAAKGVYKSRRVMSPPADATADEAEEEEPAPEEISVDEERAASSRRTGGGSKKRKADTSTNLSLQQPSTTRRKVSDSSTAAMPAPTSKPNKKGKTAASRARNQSPVSKASSEFGGTTGKTSGSRSGVEGDDATSVHAEAVQNPLKPTESEEGVVHWRTRYHPKGLTYVAWNPVAMNILVTGGTDPTCCIWDFKEDEDRPRVAPGEKGDLEQLVSLPTVCRHFQVGRNKAISQVMWDEAGNILVTGCADGNVRAYSAGGDFLGIHARHNGLLTGVAINNSGNTIVTAGEDKVVSTWSLAALSSRDIDANHTAFVTDIDFYDDEVFATCSEDATIHFHSLTKLGARGNLIGHTSLINMIRFSPVGPPGTKRMLASVSDDKSVRIWDVEDVVNKAKRVATPALSTASTPRIKQEDVKKEDDYFAFPSSGGGKGKNPAGSACRRLSGHTDCVHLVEWCPAMVDGNKRLIATASWANNLSKTDDDTRNVIKVFDALSGTCLYSLTAHTSKIHKLEFAPKVGTLFASCSDDGQLIVWETKTGKEVRRYEADCSINDVNWRSDGQQLAMAAGDGSLRTMFVGDLLKD